jgi:predicted unusual protein kinase regulating ubiquinone biosynthesis (AarF/ABC1/UbiB family)
MLVEWFFDLLLPRLGLRRLAARGRDRRLLRIARGFRELAADLGGLMIKVGQFMSTRLDVLPPRITDELSALQDEVSPVPADRIRTVIEAEFGTDLRSVFVDFQDAPTASASLGQAHRARLHADRAADAGFREVVVKVQRPGIDQVIEVDLRALRRVASVLARVTVIRTHTDVPALVEEFSGTCHEEIDYLHEARSAERFRENFAGDARAAAPEVAWENTTRRVLTLQDVTAIKISDTAALHRAGIDPAEVAEDLAIAMFDQFFQDGFFHADPHPGNIFVTPGPKAEDGEDRDRDWHLTFVDFGMMGEVTTEVRDQFRALVLAIASRDAHAMVTAMQRLDVLLPSAETAQLERAMSELFDRFGGMSVTDLQDVDPDEFSAFFREFGDVLRDLPFQLPEDFLLIIRGVSLLNGLATALDPEFDIWRIVQPYVTELARSEASKGLAGLGSSALGTARTLTGLPRRIDEVVTLAERGRLQFSTPDTDRSLRRIETTLRRAVAAIVFVALFLGGILLLERSTAAATTSLIVSAVPLVMTIRPPRSGR